jgi:hypothetical protein
MNDDARCGSKPARWRCRVFFTKEWMLHEIPEEPARWGSHTSASLCLDGPTEKYGCIIPRTKSARPRNARKSWQHFEHLRTAMARSTPIKVLRSLEYSNALILNAMKTLNFIIGVHLDGKRYTRIANF